MEWTADTIRQLRAHAQMSQSQLARWLNVTVKQVKHLENHRRNPSGPVERLLDILREELGQNGATRTSLVQVLGASSSHPQSQRPPSTTAGAIKPVPTDAAMVWDT
ncbi:MAG TPA: helix-turn-helix domain-containing protein [Verrucomicrobiae bacterium]|nr:helix-turn-helix domain-containing protein [Verrucomicrobiae bacterium]